MDFTTPFLKWLLQCEDVAQNPLFLNAVQVSDNAKQVVTQEIKALEDVEFIDGSVLHKVYFTLFDFKSISFNELFTDMLNKSENVEDLLDTGKLNTWILEQNKARNFPNFGVNFEVQSVKPLYLTPSTPTIDTGNGIAKYMLPIVCEVLESGA